MYAFFQDSVPFQEYEKLIFHYYHIFPQGYNETHNILTITKLFTQKRISGIGLLPLWILRNPSKRLTKNTPPLPERGTVISLLFEGS
ncbi:hypothetical protein BIV59_06040 [Bacillus sp. MUM 13]|nr:hypothetical protein BIV59_06040 [Bacillus sp. MUM 13]